MTREVVAAALEECVHIYGVRNFLDRVWRLIVDERAEEMGAREHAERGAAHVVVGEDGQPGRESRLEVDEPAEIDDERQEHGNPGKAEERQRELRDENHAHGEAEQIGATLVTGDPFWDAVGTISIGALLITVAVFVAVEVKDLLIGQSVEPTAREEMEAFLRARPEIRELFSLLTMQFGPDAMVAVKARMVATGSERQMIAAINAIERDFRARFQGVAWLFFEPDVAD